MLYSFVGIEFIDKEERVAEAWRESGSVAREVAAAMASFVSSLWMAGT
jgi:hypothetical protein